MVQFGLLNPRHRRPGLMNPPRAGGGTPPAQVAPAFTTQPALLGSTALGSTVTVSLGSASGTPAPTLTGTLTRPGKAAAAALDGATFVIEAADQGGTITLDVTAANSAGSASASASLAVPAAPTVQNVQDGGYIGTTSSIDTSTGKVTIDIARAANVITPDTDFKVGQWALKVDGIQGKNLAADVSGTYNFNNNADGWRAAWAYDLLGPWNRFDNDPLAGGVTQASNNGPATQNTVYIANKPLMLQAAWDAAIARWKASPHTRPTASGNTDWVVGTLPAVAGLAPAKEVHGFLVGTGPLAAVATTGVHPEEHVGMHVFTAFVDFLLGDDPAAVSLRSKFTFRVYPNLNPQARYVGAARAEIETGTLLNSNRLWTRAGNANVNLARVMRAVWAADLPDAVEIAFDFHDAPYGPNGAELITSKGANLRDAIVAEYVARTGASVTTDWPPAETSIAHYMSVVRWASKSITVEHGTNRAQGVADWQAWGRDVARGLNAVYATAAPTRGPLQEPQWLTRPGTTVTRDTNGDWLFTCTDANPFASLEIPAGKTIEVLFEGTPTSSKQMFIRQAADPVLTPATATQIGDTRTAYFNDVLTVTHDPAKPYVGIIQALTGTTRTMRLGGAIRWREVLA